MILIIKASFILRFYNFFCFFVLLMISYFWASGFGGELIYGWQYRGHEISWFFFGLVVVATILGVFLGLLYEHINDHDGAETWWRRLPSLIHTKRFGSALIAAPLIVYAVFSSVYDANLDGAIFFSCLQSGFFWERTFKAVSK